MRSSTKRTTRSTSKTTSRPETTNSLELRTITSSRLSKSLKSSSAADQWALTWWRSTRKTFFARILASSWFRCFQMSSKQIMFNRKLSHFNSKNYSRQKMKWTQLRSRAAPPTWWCVQPICHRCFHQKSTSLLFMNHDRTNYSKPVHRALTQAKWQFKIVIKLQSRSLRSQKFRNQSRE